MLGTLRAGRGGPGALGQCGIRAPRNPACGQHELARLIDEEHGDGCRGEPVPHAVDDRLSQGELGRAPQEGGRRALEHAHAFLRGLGLPAGRQELALVVLASGGIEDGHVDEAGLPIARVRRARR